MKAHLLHVKEGNRTWWVISDGSAIVRGAISEPKAEVILRWEVKTGRDLTEYVRVRGYCRPSEAAMILGDLAREADASRKAARGGAV